MRCRWIAARRTAARRATASCGSRTLPVNNTLQLNTDLHGKGILAGVETATTESTRKDTSMAAWMDKKYCTQRTLEQALRSTANRNRGQQPLVMRPIVDSKTA